MHSAATRDRRAPLERALRRQGLLASWVTRWDAGAELDEQARDTHYSPLLAHPIDSRQSVLVGPLSDAEISLGLKHLEALRAIARSTHPFGVIVEDDVQFLEFVRAGGGNGDDDGAGHGQGERAGRFSASVCRRVSLLEAQLGGWDVLCLGSEIEGTECEALPECRGRSAAARRAGVFRKRRGAAVPLFEVGAQNLMRLSGAHAVSRDAARWLSKALVPFSLPIDAQLNWLLNLRSGGGSGAVEGEGEGGGEGEGEVSLRDNYVAILSAIAKQLEAGVTPRALLGCDCTRLRASVELFERASAGGFDSECHELCTRILEKVQ